MGWNASKGNDMINIKQPAHETLRNSQDVIYVITDSGEEVELQAFYTCCRLDQHHCLEEQVLK